MTDQIQSLHACWCQVTGQELHFKATERIFWEMAKLDFTADDLLIVLKDVLQYNRTHSNFPMKIQIHKLCSDLEIFASMLASAKAKNRNKLVKPTPKESILESWRPTAGERVSGANVHRISEIFNKMKHEAGA